MKKQFGMGIVLLLMMAVALCIGRYGSDASDVLQALLFDADTIMQKLVWNIRMPRILLVCLCGAALALSGMVYQTIFQNPLASGDVIGASSGCSLGAVIAILYFPSSWAIESCAFLGGILSVILVIYLGSKGKGNRIVNLLVAGLILQALMTSLMMMLKIHADPFHQLANIEYWLMGGFSDVGWPQVGITAALISSCTLLLYLFRWKIQMLSFQDEAQTLGIKVEQVRWLALILATLLISSVISIAGIVSWAGLLVPHIVSRIQKRPFSQQFGMVILVGACFLLLCDTLARTLFVMELPISILTSLFGAFFLLVLFAKGRLKL